MKKLSLFLASILSATAFVLAPVAVMAAPASETKPETVTAETTTQRIVKNKTKYPVKLTDADSTKLKGKCKAAQVISKALLVQVNKKNSTRQAAYTEVTTAVTDAIKEFKTDSKDTATLELIQKELSTKITKYNTDLTAYVTSLSDLNDLDCVTDPAGFKSSLEAARANRKVVAEDVITIKQYINKDLKDQLKVVKEAKTTKETEATPTPTTPTTTGGNQ